MITKSMPLQAEEKKEIHIDDDDVILLAIPQVPHKTRKKDFFFSLIVIFLLNFNIMI
jgi:hypothetical protein